MSGTDADNMQFHGDVEFGNGTQQTPSLTNVGDNDTGFYFPEQDKIGVTIAGTHKVTFSGDGVDVTGSVTTKPAAGNDSVVVAGRAGGTSSYAVTVSPNVLTANRNIKFPDSSGTLALVGEGGAGGSSATVTNDTSTNSDSYYPLMFTDVSGTLGTAYVSSTKMYYNPSGGQLSCTNFNSLSDARSKENVKTLENSLDKVMNMRGVSFTWKDSGDASVGVIAQELETVLPEAVYTSDRGIKSVSYGMIIGVLIESIKDQQAQIDELKAKLQVE
jgi:hypothetical protein